MEVGLEESMRLEGASFRGKERGGQTGLGTLPPSAAFSHISAGRGRISHALPLRPPPPPLGPARAGGSSARELAGLAAAGRPAALLPPPDSAAATASPAAPAAPAPFTSGEGREEGDEGPTGSSGPVEHLGVTGLNQPPSPSLQNAKTKPRSAGGGAGPRRPRFTSRAATEGSSDVRFPVSLVPDTRRLSQARAAISEGKSWELRSPRDPLAQGGSPEGNRGTGTRTGPQPRAPACACQRTGLPAPGPSTMHLLGFLALACSLLAAALIPGPREAPATAAAFESGLGFSEAEPDRGEVKAFTGKDLEEQLRAVSSVDELMSVLYPDYWKMYKCQLRKGGWQQPTLNTRTGDTVKFAAAHYNTEILKSIDNEWRKTQCMPREVCIDVGKEFGAATNTFFKPPCVSVYRCGGCCNSEGLQCMNTSTGYLSKTLFEITVPLSQGPKPVTISFANHTSCRCMSKLDVYRQVHSIIRRSLPATLSQCQAVNKTCPANYVWNNYMCRCLAQQDFIFYSNAEDDSTNGFHDVCGPNKELDEDTCQCVCKGGLRPSSCGPHKELDRNSCQCVCKNKLFPSSCGANREFDENTCQCVCKRTCPRNQPLNPGKCACECTENTQKCFLKGKKFHHQTCSCYRRPCTNRLKHCDPGLSFSEEVCRCVPSYWKRPHMS